MGWVFRSTCVVCTEPGAVICRACWHGLDPPATEGPAALFAYSGTGREVVAALKFRGRRVLAPFLGPALAELAGPDIDVVTWAPTSRARRVARGFDQAEGLARATAKALCVPWRRCLNRSGGPSQTGRDRLERRVGPTFSAALQLGDDMIGRRVLVIDDVVTTGATLQAAGRTLLEAGFGSVDFVVVAKTARIVPNSRW